MQPLKPWEHPPYRHAAQIVELLDRLYITPSTIDKTKILRIALEDEFFRKVVRYALDPFKTFGIAVTPEVDETALITRDFSAYTYDIFATFDKLADRQLSGLRAHTAVKDLLIHFNASSRDLFLRILLKDLRANVAAKLVNNARAGTIPVFNCMLAHKYEEKHITSWPVHVEEKIDGVRCLALYNRGSIQFVSRSGKQLPGIPSTFGSDFVRHLDNIDMPSHVFDGELTEAGGRFLDTVGGVRRKHRKMINPLYTIFDFMETDEFISGQSRFDQSVRFEGLIDLFDDFRDDSQVRRVTGFPANNHDEVMAVYKRLRKGGAEGAMVKDPNAHYVTKRNRGWLKLKTKETLDLEIVGFEEGTGKYAGCLGALIVKHEGVEVKVGTGFSEPIREWIWNDRVNMLGAIVEVSFQEQTPAGSLRHPSFEGFRYDKE